MISNWFYSKVVFMFNLEIKNEKFVLFLKKSLGERLSSRTIKTTSHLFQRIKIETITIN